MTVVAGLVGGCGGGDSSPDTSPQQSAPSGTPSEEEPLTGMTPQEVVDIWNTPDPKGFADENPNFRFELMAPPPPSSGGDFKADYGGPFVNVDVSAGDPVVTFSQGEGSTSLADQWIKADAAPGSGWTKRKNNWWERRGALQNLVASVPDWNATRNPDGTLQVAELGD